MKKFIAIVALFSISALAQEAEIKSMPDVSNLLGKYEGKVMWGNQVLGQCEVEVKKVRFGDVAISIRNKADDGLTVSFEAAQGDEIRDTKLRGIQFDNLSNPREEAALYLNDQGILKNVRIGKSDGEYASAPGCDELSPVKEPAKSEVASEQEPAVEQAK
jgi:hypothetical protein